jgi:hypothetical protein
VLRTACCLHSLKGACFASNKPMMHLQTPPLAKPLPGSADEVLCFDPPTWHNPPCTSLCQKHLSAYRSELEQDAQGLTGKPAHAPSASTGTGCSSTKHMLLLVGSRAW